MLRAVELIRRSDEWRETSLSEGAFRSEKAPDQGLQSSRGIASNDITPANDSMRHNAVLGCSQSVQIKIISGVVTIAWLLSLLKRRHLQKLPLYIWDQAFELVFCCTTLHDVNALKEEVGVQRYLISDLAETSARANVLRGFGAFTTTPSLRNSRHH